MVTLHNNFVGKICKICPGTVLQIGRDSFHYVSQTTGSLITYTFEPMISAYLLDIDKSIGSIEVTVFADNNEIAMTIIFDKMVNPLPKDIIDLTGLITYI